MEGVFHQGGLSSNIVAGYIPVTMVDREAGESTVRTPVRPTFFTHRIGISDQIRLRVSRFLRSYFWTCS